MSIQHKDLKSPFLLDIVLLVTTFCLSFFSLIMIYSTTGVVSLEKFGDPFFYVKRQAVAVLLGMILLLLASNLKIDWLRRISPWLFVISLFLLALTFIPGLKHSSGGADRWIKLPFLNFQPAELVKIFFIIFLAGFFARRQELLGAFRYSVLLPFIYVSILAVILLKQPDFGSSAIIVLVTLCMILAVGVRIRYLLYCSVPLIFAAACLIVTSPYRMQRLLAFLSPSEDTLGRGYQLTQSLIAVSSGKLFGVGLGDSMQKLYFLPAAHTDFLYAVVAEELGLFGALIIIFAFLIVLWRGLAIAERLTHDLFSYSLAVGLTMLLVVPAFVNIGVVTGMLPTKGLVLPLLGSGGSSMICSLLIIGLLLALAKHHYRNVI